MVRNKGYGILQQRQATLKAKVKTPKKRIHLCLHFLMHRNRWLHSWETLLTLRAHIS